MTKTPKFLSPLCVRREVERLRNEARYAYLDGRNMRARQLNRKADKLAETVFQMAVEP